MAGKIDDVEITYKDLGRDRLEASMRSLKGLEVRVGVQGRTGYRAVQKKVIRRGGGATSGPEPTGKRRRGKKQRGGRRGKPRSGADNWPERTAKRVVIKTVHQVRVVDLATFHEFGAPKVNLPERSFIRSTVRGSLPFLKALMKRNAEAIITGANPIPLLAQTGLRLEAGIRKTITTMKSPPLAESTRRRRYMMTGDAWPQMLIDTGQLVNSISSIVVHNGKRVGGLGGVGE